jgi:hypothetical protein
MKNRDKLRQVERLVPRKEAAIMLGYQNPMSVYRLEVAGKLTPVRVNCRRTCYVLEDIQRLMGGK